MKPLAILVLALTLVLGLSSCSTFGLDKLNAEGSASGALCIEGSGPPMTGSGHVAAAHTNDGFKGQITITPDCGVQIISE
jgi:hypothetical protein